MIKPNFSRRTTGARWRTRLGVSSGVVLVALAASALSGTSAVAADASSTLVVQAGQVLRPVTHVATGSLYGLADDSTPSDALVQAIKPNEFVQMAAGGHQQAKGDVAVVAAKANRAGAKVVDRMSDYYAGWPYQYSASTWPGIVSNQVETMKNTSNLAAFAIWNEPDNTWNTSNGTFENFWTTTYREIRSLDTTTPIQGPSFSDNISDMQNFLQNAVNTNTVPDILAWHELENSGKITTDVANVTAMEKSLGISPRPIDIEEYAAPSQVGLPGQLVPYIAQFERSGVHSAELAFWNGYGALGDLLTGTGGQPNGAYWLYTWYAQMSGNMLVTTPPNATGIDGAASLTSNKQELDVIAGRGTGASAVTINGLGSTSLGGTVTVTVQDTPGSGRTTAVSGPTTISTSTMSVVNGSITVPITMNVNDGYHIVVTPGSAPNLAGTYTVKNVNSGLLLDVQNGGTAWGTLADQTASSGSSTQKWTLVGAGSNQYKIVNKANGLVLGIQNASTTAGADALVWGDSGTADHLWTFASAGSGQYKITNVNSGLLLGITGASKSSGAIALQWSDSGTADHLWTLTATS